MVVTKLLFTNLSLVKISLITFALGLLIKLLQALITNGTRKFDIHDLGFNLMGIVLGLIILLVYRGVENGKEKWLISLCFQSMVFAFIL